MNVLIIDKQLNQNVKLSYQYSTVSIYVTLLSHAFNTFNINILHNILFTVSLKHANIK